MQANALSLQLCPVAAALLARQQSNQTASTSGHVLSVPRNARSGWQAAHQQSRTLAVTPLSAAAVEEAPAGSEADADEDVSPEVSALLQEILGPETRPTPVLTRDEV